MKSKNLFRLTIVFFMVLAIGIFCVYEYLEAQGNQSFWADYQSAFKFPDIVDPGFGPGNPSRTIPGLTPINVSVSDLFTPNRVSLALAPSIAPQYQMPYYDMFMQDSLMTVLPEMSRWSRSPAMPTEMFSQDLSDSLRLWDITMAVPSYATHLIQPGWSPGGTELRPPILYVDYGPAGFDGFERMDAYGWATTSPTVQPVTSNWSLYERLDLVARPLSQRNVMYQFQEAYDVTQTWQPKTWAAFGGAYPD